MKVIEAEKGETMFGVSARACLHATTAAQECKVLHNGALVSVYPGSLSTDIYEKLYYKQIVDNYDARLK